MLISFYDCLCKTEPQGRKHQRMRVNHLKVLSFVSCCLLWISLTASCKYIFCQVILIVSCFNSLIRLSRYRSSQSMSGNGMNRSGSFWIMENKMSSSLLWKFWKNSLVLLWSLISMCI